MHHFETVLALLVGVTFLALVARRLDVPTPALLVAGGVLVAVLPGLPVVQFDPQLVFLVFIPPLLYRASLLASYRDVRANLRPILLLGVGHVLFVTILVALVARLTVPVLPARSALALGAVLPPPDVARAHLGVSGILAVVATRLYLGRVGPRVVVANTRVQNSGMWDVVVFVLEGLIFIITGLALRPILGSWSGPFARDLVWGAVLVSVTVIVARFVWVVPSTYLPRLLSARVRQRDPSPPWQLPVLVSWAGLRGADSLVLAAAIPTLTATGAPFPGRDLIIAITFAVILVTLLGQGFTLAPLLRWLRDEGTIGDAVMRRVQRELDYEELLLHHE